MTFEERRIFRFSAIAFLILLSACMLYRSHKIYVKDEQANPDERVGFVEWVHRNREMENGGK